MIDATLPQTDTLPEKDRTQWRFAAFVALGGLAVGLLYLSSLWRFDGNGLSVLSGRLPYWDFTNLWAGSRMALDGDVALLFDAPAYQAALRAMFSPFLPEQEWSYPPSIILIGAPLATMPIWLAYGIWTLGTITLLHFAIRPLALNVWVHAAALTSPAVIMNALFGQNGSLTAALIIGGLLAAPRRPVLAGVLFGILTIKPHLGVLIPVCLIASANWRAFLSAALTGSAIALATGLIFGFDVWAGFLHETRPLMTAIMEAEYPQHYHANALTVFIMARSFGADVSTAMAAQLVATLCAVAFVGWLWRPGNLVEHRKRVLMTATLTLLSTPYGYSYDAVPMCVAVAFMFVATARPRAVLLAIVWLFPYMLHQFHFHGIGIGVLMPMLFALWMGADCIRDRMRAAADNRGLRSYGATALTSA